MPINWLERLSLDAVIVALVWGWALNGLAGGSPDMGSALVLALATWLTYVADRLRDVRPGRTIPATDRHAFYRRHCSLFQKLFTCGLVVVVLFAIWVLPLWKWAWGWGLVLFILLYLYLLGKDLDPSKRLMLKRLVVPVVFATGTGWMAESWRTTTALLATGVLFAGALSNVLLISLWESQDRPVPPWLQPAAMASLLLNLSASVILLALHTVSGLACLVMFLHYTGLFFWIRRGTVKNIRFLADAILLVTGLLLLGAFLFGDGPAILGV